MPVMPASFHPIIQTWFTETYGKPTAVQAQAWPLIEKGENVLALAPTGSGKTLTAFLSAISRFMARTGDQGPETRECDPIYPADQLTVLYVSPLKALNEDIRRNLLEPLKAIRRRFEQAGLTFPDIRVETRSGDTPQPQRRRFLAHPPAILALTPESLAILLLSQKGRQVLATVKYLVLDEIHAVLGNKRGAFLSCQVDRLSLIAGEFQRISLSATVHPPEAAAEFVAGIDLNGNSRTINIVAPPPEKQIELSIEYPDVVINNDRDSKIGGRYSGLINYILNRIANQTTILIFTDSRRRAEKLSYFINQEAAFQEMVSDSPVSFAHHGSLSKEIRQSVEQRLARGELPCVVATASLELGIDIGSVDEVILAGSPASVSQALQRIGRSGHSVGKVSCGRLFPFHGMDLLMAVALKDALDNRDIEEAHSIENPLDILAQMILALCVEEKRNMEKLYTLLRGFYIFKNLNHETYIRTVYMLVGLAVKEGGTETRLREIKPRIWLDKLTGEIGALDGSLLLLYASGGVIANRGQYSLRLEDGTKIGEADEEFVWERRLGDQFHFGGRDWQIISIGPEAVKIKPMENPVDFIPFWHMDISFRSPKIIEYTLNILDKYNSGILIKPTVLTSFLDTQREAQKNIPLTGGVNITVEIINSPESHRNLHTVVLHTFRGGMINYPLALALAQELEDTLKLHIESFSNDDAILFLLPHQGTPVEEIIRNAFVSLNNPDPGGKGLSRADRLFRNRLEVSGVFGANFREAAERSLLLPKAGFGKRTPLWITRQRSKRLFDTVSVEDGFPITAEAWRSCLNDMFDMAGFRETVASINDGSLSLSFFYTSIPSPFSRDMVRQETNSLMYEYDERKELPNRSGTSKNGHTATLSDKVIQEALGDAALRPALKRELLDGFTKRLRREEPGWAPEDELSLCEWVKERVAIPLDEWETLCDLLPETLNPHLLKDAEFSSGCLSPFICDRLKLITRDSASIPSVVHHEWIETWKNEALTLLGPWLRYEGPISLLRITEVFGISGLEDAVNALVETDEVVRDVAIEGIRNEELGVRNGDCYSKYNDTSELYPCSSDRNFHFSFLIPHSSLIICDRENLDLLLRLSRRKARPEIRERPATLLVPFIALRQGLIQEVQVISRDTDNRFNAAFLQKLSGCSAPAKLLESEFCTARNKNYGSDIIDREIQEGRLVWYGTGKEKIGICSPDDLDLVYTNNGQSNTHSELFSQAINSGFFDRLRDFWDIKEQTGLNSKECVKALWQEVWMGHLSSDSFEPVRRGIENGFKEKEIETDDQFMQEQSVRMSHRPHLPRYIQMPARLRNRWKGGAPIFGRWFSLATDWSLLDPLDEEMRNRDRVRLLLSRWGILCRPLLERESTPFTWSGLLPTMRRMELSGELIVGRFFAGINSLQFASPSIIHELENAEANTSGLYWMNAADLASPAGLEIDGLDPHIPARLPTSRLYFRREQLVAVSNKNSKELHIYIAPDDQDIAALIDLVKIPRTRKVKPENKILIEKINSMSAVQSEYAQVFKAAGFVSDRGRLCLW